MVESDLKNPPWFDLAVGLAGLGCLALAGDSFERGRRVLGAASGTAALGCALVLGARRGPSVGAAAVAFCVSSTLLMSLRAHERLSVEAKTIEGSTRWID
jgi:hypothetical protein